MKELTLATHGPRQTQSLGELLGRLARPGDVLLLVGTLGAGKTCLVQGMARGLDIHDSVTSPTFTLIREYRGRLSLYHVDCFRIDNPQETDELGLEDYLIGTGVCVIEWADKVMEALPPEHLMVNIQYAGDRDRTLRLQAHGPRYEQLLDELHPRRRGVEATS